MAALASIGNVATFAAPVRAAPGALGLGLAASFAELLHDELVQPGPLAPAQAPPPPRAEPPPSGYTMAWIAPVSLLAAVPDQRDPRKKRAPTPQDRRPPSRDRDSGEA